MLLADFLHTRCIIDGPNLLHYINLLIPKYIVTIDLRQVNSDFLIHFRSLLYPSPNYLPLYPPLISHLLYHTSIPTTIPSPLHPHIIHHSHQPNGQNREPHHGNQQSHLHQDPFDIERRVEEALCRGGSKRRVVLSWRGFVAVYFFVSLAWGEIFALGCGMAWFLLTVGW